MGQIKTTLFALNKDKSFQEWKVFTDGPNVVVQFGKLGGKVQTKITTCKPKNIGRANETTAEQQAELEAISKWEKQYRLGYRETTEELESEGPVSPMLANDYLKRGKDINYPAFYQPKLDGLRCLVRFNEAGESIFNSRGNKTYPIQGGIVEEIKNLSEKTGFDIFDGEIYLHGLSLQKIVSLAKKWRTQEEIQAEITKDYEADKKRQRKAIDQGKLVYLDFNKEEISIYTDPVRDDNRYGGYESSDLQFHIFDIPSDKIWYSETEACRQDDLIECAKYVGSKVVIVEGGIVKNEDSARTLVSQFIQASYEGLILRNFLGKYEFGQRSSDMQKWKEFQSIEAKVLSVTIDRNGEGVLNCVLQSGVTFSCKMKGTHHFRSYNNMLKMVGKFITISFQTYTEDNVPQFPVGLYKREVNPDTWEPFY